jgi:hypothetical protein
MQHDIHHSYIDNDIHVCYGQLEGLDNAMAITNAHVHALSHTHGALRHAFPRECIEPQTLNFACT